ncbi:MAG: tail fiber domain-containing protein [Nitrospirae bacterium]|nr:tail fiber domain-containing protein [Nitrospirota bacterium]
MGIGTSSPQRSLHIYESSNAAEIRLEHPNGIIGDIGTAGDGGAAYESFQIGTQSNHPLYFYVNGGVYKFSFNTSGYFGIGLSHTQTSYPLHMASGAYVTSGGVWTNASSRDYKKDIHKLSSEDAMLAFNQLEPVSFKYKSDDEQHVGFIAEDVPDLVASGDRKGLSSMDMVAVLTKVVQDQQKTIATLSKKVKSLETKMKKSN